MISLMTGVFMYRYVSPVVSWCFKPSQAHRIISGLKETFIKRHIVVKTNRAKLKNEKNRVRKRRVVGSNLWNEIQLTGPKDRNRHKNRIMKNKKKYKKNLDEKGVDKLGWYMSFDINHNIPNT